MDSKMWYTHHGTLLSLEKEGHSDTCCNTEDLEDFVLSEMSQTPEDKYCDSILWGP